MSMWEAFKEVKRVRKIGNIEEKERKRGKGRRKDDKGTINRGTVGRKKGNWKQKKMISS